VGLASAGLFLFFELILLCLASSAKASVPLQSFCGCAAPQKGFPLHTSEAN